MHIMESIEEHPYIAAGGVFVLGVILIVILFSGGKAATQTISSPQSDTTSATQLAMAQIQAQAATQVSNNQLAASNTSSAAAVSVAQLQASTQQNQDNVMANSAIQSAQINRDAAIGTSTIQANMLMHQDDNALQIALNNNASNVAIAGLNLRAVTDQDSTKFSAIQSGNQLVQQILAKDPSLTVGALQIGSDGSLSFTRSS